MGRFEEEMADYRTPAPTDVRTDMRGYLPQVARPVRETKKAALPPKLEPERSGPTPEELPRADDPRAEELSRQTEEQLEDGIEQQESHGTLSSGMSSSGGSSGAAAPEAMPERDEPDDGEHTDSTEEEVSARETARTEDEDDEEPMSGLVVRTVPVKPVSTDQSAGAAEPESSVRTEKEFVQTPAGASSGDRVAVATKPDGTLGDVVGTRSVPYVKRKYKAGDPSEVVAVKPPLVLMQHLRQSLEATAGSEFAEGISAASLLTAFLLAKTGLQMDVDENTEIAANIFREVDPRLLSIENKIDEVLSRANRIDEVNARAAQRQKVTGEVIDGMEFALSYLLFDRTIGVDTLGITPENFNVVHSDVLTIRERVRKRTREQRQIEIDRERRDNR